MPEITHFPLKKKKKNLPGFKMYAFYLSTNPTQSLVLWS